MAVTTRTIVGKVLDGSQKPTLDGEYRFTPTQEIRTTSGEIIPKRPTIARFTGGTGADAGQFSVELVANDSDDLAQAAGTYRVQLVLDSRPGRIQSEWNVVVPKDGTGPIELGDLAPVAEAGETFLYLTEAVADGKYLQAGALPANIVTEDNIGDFIEPVDLSGLATTSALSAVDTKATAAQTAATAASSGLAGKIDLADVVAVTPLLAEDLQAVNPVMTVNGTQPDAQGNVNVATGGGGGGTLPFVWRSNPVVGVTTGDTTVTAVSGEGISVDAGVGNVIINLPATPAKDDRVRVARVDDYAIGSAKSLFVSGGTGNYAVRDYLSRGAVRDYSFDGAGWRITNRDTRADTILRPVGFGQNMTDNQGMRAVDGLEDHGLWPRRARMKHRMGRVLKVFSADATYATTFGQIAAHPNPTHANGSITMGNTTANAARVEFTLASPVNFTDKIIRALVDVPNTTRASGNWSFFRVRLYSNGGASANFTSFDLVTSAYNVGGTSWAFAGIHTSEVGSVAGTGADLTAINYISVVSQGPSGKTSIPTIGVAQLEVLDVIAPKAKCVLWFDDYANRAWEAMKRMQPYGWAGVACTELGQPDNFNGEQYRALQRQGWQISTHSWANSDHTGVADDVIKSSFMKSRHGQMSMGLWGGDDFGYWGGFPGTAGAEYAVRQYFRSGRLYINALPHQETLPPVDPHRIFAANAETLSTTDMNATIDKVITQRGLLNLVYHTNGGSDGKFEAMLTYLDGKRDQIDVVTIDEALAPYTTYNT